jgi:DNA-binding NarL/FixJ family response regulator
VISDSAEKDVLFDAVVITSGEVGTTAKPRGRLLVAGDTGSEETHRHAIRNHVAAVIPSDVTPDQFGAIWSTVNAGYYPMPANLSSSIVGRLEKPPEDICLSGVERDIMKLLSEGATVANIAERVGCSERHARRRLRSLWDTLGADSRSQALVAATRWGLLGR